jgi:hypothetical protein
MQNSKKHTRHREVIEKPVGFCSERFISSISYPNGPPRVKFLTAFATSLSHFKDEKTSFPTRQDSSLVEQDRIMSPKIRKPLPLPSNRI